MKRFLPLFMLTGLLFGQDSLITEKNKTIIQLQVKADAKEDYNFGYKLKWSGALFVPFAIGLYVAFGDWSQVLAAGDSLLQIHGTLWHQGFQLGIAVALIAPLTAISYLSVNLSLSEIEQRLNGLDILSPKSEESQIVYHTAYEEETDRLRRKYYLLGTLSFFMIYAKYKLGNPLSAIIHYLRNAPPH